LSIPYKATQDRLSKNVRLFPLL